MGRGFELELWISCIFAILYLKIESGRLVKIVKMLLTVVKEKNPANNFGQTPFNLAEEKGFLNISQMIRQSQSGRVPLKLNVETE